MEMLHDIQRFEHRLVHHEQSFVHWLGRLFGSELFWVIFMITAIIAVTITIAILANGSYVDQPMRLTPFGLY